MKERDERDNFHVLCITHNTPVLAKFSFEDYLRLKACCGVLTIGEFLSYYLRLKACCRILTIWEFLS
jgi:hypothetical protein